MHAQSSVCVLGRRVGGGGKLEQLLATFYLKNCKQFYTKAVELFLYLTSSVLASALSCVRKEQLLHAVYLFTHFLSASNSGHCICLSYSHARERLCDNRRSLSLSCSRWLLNFCFSFVTQHIFAFISIEAFDAEIELNVRGREMQDAYTGSHWVLIRENFVPHMRAD